MPRYFFRAHLAPGRPLITYMWYSRTLFTMYGHLTWEGAFLLLPSLARSVFRKVKTHVLPFHIYYHLYVWRRKVFFFALFVSSIYVVLLVFGHYKHLFFFIQTDFLVYECVIHSAYLISKKKFVAALVRNAMLRRIHAKFY